MYKNASFFYELQGGDRIIERGDALALKANWKSRFDYRKGASVTSHSIVTGSSRFVALLVAGRLFWR